MCQVGHSDWLFTDSDACYMSNTNNRFRKCICPFTTCTETTEGYGCHLTSSVMTLAGFIMLVWMCAAAAYVWIMNTIGTMELEARTEIDSSMGHNYYYNKLFGNPSTHNNTEVEAIKALNPTSSKSNVSETSNSKIVNKGNKTNLEAESVT